MSICAFQGDDDDTAAWNKCGSLSRAKPAIMPGYDPPNATHLFVVVGDVSSE